MCEEPLIGVRTHVGTENTLFKFIYVTSSVHREFAGRKQILAHALGWYAVGTCQAKSFSL